MSDEDDMESVEAQELLEMEIDRLRAENERLRTMMARQLAADETLMELPNDCTKEEDEAAIAEHYASLCEIREFLKPNAQHEE